MKKPILFLLFCCITAIAAAQPAAPPPLNENTVVKDTTGNVYPYAIWQKLMMTGDGRIRVKYDGKGNYTYTMFLTSPQEKEAMFASMPKPTESDQFRVGSSFSHFKDKALDGYKVDTKALAGKVIVVNFWFIGCPPCRAEIPDLNKITEKYRNNTDVVFVSIALDEGYDIKDFMKDKQLGYHIIDRGRYIAAKYGVHLYPTNLVIDRSGKVAYSSHGGHPANPYWIHKTIDASLATAAPPVETASK